MNEIIESHKALGLLGGMFVFLNGLVIYFVRYIIKNSEAKNNVISNHIQHSIEAISKNTAMLSNVEAAIRDMRLIIEKLADKL